MQEAQSTNKYRELEERTYRFAEKCREFVKRVPRNVHNMEYGKQLIRSSGSQAANYIEANEALSRKDFVYRVRICRKEAKESALWLKLIELGKVDGLSEQREKLEDEATQLRKIFNAIIEKGTTK